MIIIRTITIRFGAESPGLYSRDMGKYSVCTAFKASAEAPPPRSSTRESAEMPMVSALDAGDWIDAFHGRQVANRPLTPGGDYLIF